MEAQEKTASIFPLIGQTLKQYRIEGVLGQGGMGVAYRAHDTKLQRPIALKVLSPDVTSNQERRKRFLLEARAAARITHPAIAQIYDVDDQDGTIFIAMELVEGKTVRELIQRRELDVLGAIEIGIQIADGLAKAHEMGIIHRDIKPANVILTPDGHAKVLDFGLAKLMDPSDTTVATAPNPAVLSSLTHTQVGSVKGTPAYMSPEQVKGDKLDARSDLFSLGVMIFEMATWEAPFHRESIMETMHAVAFDETPSMHTLRSNLPPELQRIVSKCLRKRPEDRYSDARALVQDLRVLRRETESGRAHATGFRNRLGELVDRVAHLRPSQYAWILGGVLGMGLVVYLLLADGGMAGFIFLSFVGIYTWRYIRHQPQRMLEWFVRKTARLPEVQLIALHEGKVTVAVDRPVSQLYSRINDLLNQCNRKLFFGDPLILVIRHDLSADERRQILSNPGLQYLRDDS